MEKKFAVNIIHRPELSPEYAEKALGKGKDVSGESTEIFEFQQSTAHKYGLKTTIQMTYASLFSEKIIGLAKQHSAVYGDEIGLSLLGLPCRQFKEKYHTEDFCIWMFDEETKKAVIDDVFGKFISVFGFCPQSTGSYFLDAFTINYIKEKYPSVKCAVATCWEEGPKAYHTCNNSWYTFMDGGPWNPWIPSKANSHCPAFSKEDDSGIVAIPHLSRDLLACFDGNGSNFGTHPQNVLRGMIYYKENGVYEYPYLYNLIDQYRHLEKYNDGYCYNMMFVGPGWLNKKGRWEAPYELLAKSYDDAMKYYGSLKSQGLLDDMTMSGFADYYRASHSDYSSGEHALWKDILYGSGKEYFWYADPYMRVCLDFNQGGAVIDMRPYVSRVKQDVGIGTDNVYDASYPYLIQANYRAGYFTHYAGAGTVMSCKVSCKGESADLCLCRTMARFEKTDGGVRLTANPVTLTLGGHVITVESSFVFVKGKGEISITRKIKADVPVTVTEYFTGAFGTTEYQADMTSITLGAGNETINYSYRGRSVSGSGNDTVFVNIPDINTRIEMSGNADSVSATEGIAFSPVYRLSLDKTLENGEVRTCLRLKREN